MRVAHQFNTQHSTFHILNADATLYAEGGEECGEYTHDKLKHGLEGFFVWVFHIFLIIKVIDMTSGCVRDAFDWRVLLFILQSYNICGWQSYVGVRCWFFLRKKLLCCDVEVVVCFLLPIVWMLVCTKNLLVSFLLRSYYMNSAPLTCAPRMGKSIGTMGWCMSFDTCESKSCTHSVPFTRFGIFGAVVLLILYFISCCRFLFKLLIISLLEGRGCVPVPVVPVVPINVWSLRFLFSYI